MCLVRVSQTRVCVTVSVELRAPQVSPFDLNFGNVWKEQGSRRTEFLFLAMSGGRGRGRVEGGGGEGREGEEGEGRVVFAVGTTTAATIAATIATTLATTIAGHIATKTQFGVLSLRVC